MKGMKRILAMLLAVVMVVGLIPATVFAAETVLDAAIFCSDLHGSTSNLESILEQLNGNGVDYSSIGFVGDTCLYEADLESLVKEKLGDSAITDMYCFADSHDGEGEDGGDIYENWDYSGEVEGVSNYYLVYTIRETDMQNASDAATAAPAFTTWYNGLSAAQKKLPIFIMSHRPLHARRGDNAGAPTWYSAISAAAESSDIVVFWAHNHTNETDVDTAAYYVAKDGTETFTVYNGDTVVPNFTYMNAGYIDANGQNPKRKPVATTVQITADSLIFQDYTTTGTYTDASYSHNVTVEREFAAAEVTLSSIAISGTTSYYVGDKLALTVTATYSDGTTADVTADATLTGYDMNTAGTQTVTATYGEKTATTSITVSEPATLTSIKVTGETEYTVGGNGLTLTVTATYDDGTTADVTADATFSPAELTASGTYTVTASYGGLTDTIDVTVKLYDEVLNANNELVIAVEAFSQGATALEVTWDDAADAILEAKGLYTDYVVYDLAVTNPGESTEYAMSLVENMDTTNLAVYHVADDGTLTPVPCTIENDCVVFTTSLTGAFAYGSVVVPEGYTAASVTVANTPANMFTDGSLDMTDAVITVTYTKADAEDFIRKLTVYDYDIDALTFVDNGNIRTYTFTFDGVSDTFNVSVWGHDFTASDVTVHVEGEEYGVTNVTVTENTDADVSTAIANVIKSGTYKAYDIELVYANGYSETTDTKTVTLPIPSGVNNPVVYYVSDDGATVTNMNAVKDGNGNVTFTTTHFSTYVIGESTEITVPENKTATDSSTTTGETTKTVYVLVDTPEDGEEYLIVSNDYALVNSSGSATGVEVEDQGEITIDGTTYEGYIELDNANAVWTAGTGWTFKNGSYYLIYSSSSSGGNQSGPDGGDRNSYSVALSTSSQSWTYDSSSNYLYVTITSSNNQGGPSGGSGNSSTPYYIYYGSSGWSLNSQTSGNGSSSSSRTVYFYKEVTYKVDTSVTKSGTYAIDGEDISVAVSEGSTANLTSTLTFEPAADNTATVESPVDVSTTATYEIVTEDINGNTVNGDPNGIIDSISEDGVVTFTGNYGTALVKVSYETDFGTVTDYITVEATAPYYTIDITDGTKGETDEETNVTTYPSVTSTIALKGITAGQTYQLYYVLEGHGIEVPDGVTVTWTSSNESVATVDANGLVTLTGTGGSTTITVTYQVDENTAVTDTINLTAALSNWYTSADGGENFPAFPNEGAVRFDKTATAVGNFSQTGISQVELSMTGVPYTTGSQIDVVLMLDITGSMKDVTSTVDGTTVYTRIVSTIAAAKAFARTIVLNEDGTYNNNRIGIYSFNSGGTYTLHALSAITDIDTLETEIDKFANNYATGGTPYDDGLALVQSTLAAAKTDGTGNNRQQFAVFMTDGVPTDYEYVTGSTHANYSSASSVAGMFTSSSTSESLYDTRSPTAYYYEYYSTQMKADNVTIYTVGLGLFNENSAWSGTATQCGNLASVLLNDISGPAGETTQPDAVGTSTLSKKDSYFFSVDDADAATDMANIFAGIAQSILEAATDVVVTDKIADAYTMVFDIPTGTNDIENLDSQEFYIEVKEYALDSNHERTTSTSLIKLYLGQSNGSYFAASDASGTAYASPVFGTTAIGTMFYWTTTENTDSGVSVTVDGTTYYFVASGKSNTASDFDATVWFNMTSGAYASGTIDSETNMSTDVIIATPYFVYNASTRMLVWTAEKLSGSELALSYFLYLDRSATEVGTGNEIDAGTYPTNDYAYLTYTNHLGNSCYQEFPEPQMTWNGAQVTYVFYLVNAAGQPVNQYGQVVDFANAVFVTAPVTESVVWNEETEEGVASLDVNWAAENILPAGYTIYDAAANYELHVYETETGELAGINRFIISGSEANGATSSTTKVYNTKAGTKYSAYGTYTSGTVTGTTTTVLSDFDFANTTVAFAVTWSAKLLPDVVVVDYGLPVAIQVLANDMVSATLNSVSASPYSAQYEMNTGVADTGFATLADGYMRLSNGDTVAPYGDAVYYVQKDMQFNEPATFYYDAQVTYYKDSNKLTGYIYSQVTVIPATTVYYEDSFVTLTTYAEDGTATDGWETAGTTATNVVQGTDRPGVGNLDDANNLYGSDKVYSSYSQYSLGSAAKITVNGNSYGTAEFSFYGTGFDVISMTSSDTGVIAVQVSDADGNVKVAKVVNTYYGYEYGLCEVTYVYTYIEETNTYTWLKTVGDPVEEAGEAGEPTENPTVGDSYTTYENCWYVSASENPLYQVPVLEVAGLDYGFYNVTITATYIGVFDDTAAAGYDLYLDAIRIYDPTGVAGGDYTNDPDGVILDAYLEDGEAWPSYTELRNNVISASNITENDDGTVSGTAINGVVFIDGNAATNAIADYVSYGPNNELYLAKGQSITFNVTTDTTIADVQVGMKLANGSETSYKIYTANSDGTTSNTITGTVKTATDMYYSIKDQASGTIVITNTGDGILSLTNIKITYKENPNGESAASLLWADGETVGYALMSLRRAAVDTEDTVTGDTTDTEVGDTVNGGTTDTETGNTVNGGTTDTEVDDTVTGETNAPEADDTVTEDTENNKPAEDVTEEETPEVDTPAEDETTGEAPAEQLGFWARLWNAIKNAFKQLLSWFGF